MDKYLKGVKPLKRKHNVVSFKSKICTNVVVQHNDDVNFVAIKSVLLPISRKEKRKFHVERTIDLHGYTKEQAYVELIRFFSQCQQNNVHHVIVVTGGNSLRNSTLRRSFQDWIHDNFGNYVSACTNANIWHGGEGAFYVVIRKSIR